MRERPEREGGRALPGKTCVSPSPSHPFQPAPADPAPPALPLYDVTVSDPVKHGEGVSVRERDGGREKERGRGGGADA